MADFAWKPRRIPQTGDDTPAGSLLGYVRRMSGPHQPWICLLALAVAGLGMAPIALQRRIVDDAVLEADLDLLAGLAAAYIGVLLAHGAAKYLLRLYQGWLSESAIRHNRAHLARLHAARAGAAGEPADGQVVSVVGAEVDKLGGFVGAGLSQPVVNLGMLFAVAGYMLAVEPWVALVSLAFLAPQTLAVPLVQRRINALVERRVALLRDLGDRLVELPREGAGSADALAAPLDRIYANRMRILLLKFGLKAAVNLLNALAPLSVLAFGGYLVMQGETTIGVVVAFLSGFERLADPLRELIAYYRLAAQAGVQHKMIARWMA